MMAVWGAWLKGCSTSSQYEAEEFIAVFTLAVVASKTTYFVTFRFYPLRE
jgi:hypothetical protein